MLTAVVFPDVEKWAVDWLHAKLAARPESYAANVYVATKVPDRRTERMVIVRRDGGNRVDVAGESARLAVRVFTRVDVEGGDLGRLVVALLAASPGEGPVYACPFISGPTPVPEESPDHVRLISAELLVRGSNL